MAKVILDIQDLRREFKLPVNCACPGKGVTFKVEAGEFVNHYG